MQYKLVKGKNGVTNPVIVTSSTKNTSNNNSSSGAFSKSMDEATYKKYDQNYNQYKKTGSYGNTTWMKDDELNLYKNIKFNKGKSTYSDGKYYYMDNDTYDKYGKNRYEWKSTGSYGDTSWMNIDDVNAYKAIRGSRSDYDNAFDDFRYSLNDDILKTVSEKYKSQWGDKYYYDMSDPEDVVRMQNGQMPKYVESKYDLNDSYSKYLYENNLPFNMSGTDGFSDMYSAAYKDWVENQANSDVADEGYEAYNAEESIEPEADTKSRISTSNNNANVRQADRTGSFKKQDMDELESVNAELTYLKHRPGYRDDDAIADLEQKKSALEQQKSYETYQLVENVKGKVSDDYADKRPDTSEWSSKGKIIERSVNDNSYAPLDDNASIIEKAANWIANHSSTSAYKTTKDYGLMPNELGASVMTKEQKATYNYLANNVGEEQATNYFNMIKQGLYDELAKMDEAEAKEAAEQSPVLASLYGALTQVGQSIGGYAMLLDDEAYVNDPRARAVRMAGVMRETVSEDMSDAGSTVYGFGMSILDNAARMLTTGKASLGVMAGSVYASKQSELMSNGCTTDQAKAGAALSAMFEIATEWASLENLLDGKVAASLLQTALKQGGIEASEEFASSVLNTFTYAVNAAGENEFEAKRSYYISQGESEEDALKHTAMDIIGQIGADTIGGFVSGLFFGSADYALDQVKYKIATEEYNKSAEANGQLNNIAGEKLQEDCKTCGLSNEDESVLNEYRKQPFDWVTEEGKKAFKAVTDKIHDVANSLRTIQAEEASDKQAAAVRLSKYMDALTSARQNYQAALEAKNVTGMQAAIQEENRALNNYINQSGIEESKIAAKQSKRTERSEKLKRELKDTISVLNETKQIDTEYQQKKAAEIESNAQTSNASETMVKSNDNIKEATLNGRTDEQNGGSGEADNVYGRESGNGESELVYGAEDEGPAVRETAEMDAGRNEYSAEQRTELEERLIRKPTEDTQKLLNDLTDNLRSNRGIETKATQVSTEDVSDEYLGYIAKTSNILGKQAEDIILYQHDKSADGLPHGFTKNGEISVRYSGESTDVFHLWHEIGHKVSAYREAIRTALGDSYDSILDEYINTAPEAQKNYTREQMGEEMLCDLFGAYGYSVVTGETAQLSYIDDVSRGMTEQAINSALENNTEVEDSSDIEQVKMSDNDVIIIDKYGRELSRNEEIIKQAITDDEKLGNHSPFREGHIQRLLNNNNEIEYSNISSGPITDEVISKKKNFKASILQNIGDLFIGTVNNPFTNLDINVSKQTYKESASNASRINKNSAKLFNQTEKIIKNAILIGVTDTDIDENANRNRKNNFNRLYQYVFASPIIDGNDEKVALVRVDCLFNEENPIHRVYNLAEIKEYEKSKSSATNGIAVKRYGTYSKIKISDFVKKINPQYYGNPKNVGGDYSHFDYSDREITGQDDFNYSQRSIMQSVGLESKDENGSFTSVSGSEGKERTKLIDSTYKNAINLKDEALQRNLVKEEAEEKMPDSKIRDEEGNLLKVYHGSSDKFNTFDMTLGRANMDIQGSFFSPWEIDAGGYGENVRSFYLNIKNPAPESVAYKALNMYKGQNNAGRKAAEYLKSQGYDGVNNGNEEYIAFYPSQIKSADPITYDDNGNIIPLSERFKNENEDVRYSDREVLPATRQESLNLDIADERNVTRYQSEVQSVLDGTFPSWDSVLVGKPTELLSKYMGSDNPLYIGQKAIKKAVDTKQDGGKHGLGTEIVNNLVEHINNPLAITGNTTDHKNNNDHSIIVWTNMFTEDGAPIIAPIRIDISDTNGNGIHNEVITIFDVYNPNYLEDLVKDENVLYTRENKNIRDLLSQWRQLPKSHRVDVSNDNIEGSIDDVKYSDREITAGKEDASNPLARWRADVLNKAVELYDQGVTPSEYLKSGNYDNAVAAQLRGMMLRNGQDVGGKLSSDKLDPIISDFKNYKNQGVLALSSPQRVFNQLGQYRYTNIKDKAEQSENIMRNLHAAEWFQDNYTNYLQSQKRLKNMFVEKAANTVADIGANDAESVLAQLVGEGIIPEDAAKNAVEDKKYLLIPLGSGAMVLTKEKGRLQYMADGETLVTYTDGVLKKMIATQKEVDSINKDEGGNKDERIREAKKKSGLPLETPSATKLVQNDDHYSLVNGAGETIFEMDGKNAYTGKVKQLTDTLTGLYKDMYNAVQTVLVENGYKPMGKIEDYFPHGRVRDTGINGFLESIRSEDLPVDKAGMTKYFVPGKPWNGHLLQRLGDNTDYHAVRGFDNYLNGMSEVIYMTPVIQRFRQLENAIRTGKSSSTGTQYETNNNLSSFVSWLHDYTNGLANKKADLDRSTESMTDRRIYTIPNKIAGVIGGSYIAGNVGTALSNVASLAQGVGEINPKYVSRAVADYIHEKTGNKLDDFNEKCTFLVNRQNAAQETVTNLGMKMKAAGESALYGLIEATDEFSTKVIARAKYYDYLAQGMSEEKAMEETSRFCLNLFADRSKGNKASIFNSKVLNAVTQFQLEPLNMIFHYKDIHNENLREQYREILKKNNGVLDGVDWKNVENQINMAGVAKKDISMIMGRVLATSVYGLLMRILTGRDKSWNPAGIVYDMVQGAKEDGFGGAVDALKDDIYDNIPFSSLIQGIASNFDSDYNTSSNIPMPFLSGLVSAGTNLAKGNVLTAASYLIPGGTQLRKTVGGIEALAKGGVYDLNGNLKYPVEPNALNIMRGTLFGTSAMAPADGYTKLSSAKTEQYKEAVDNGLNSDDMYYLLGNISGNGTNAMKALEIATSDRNGDGEADFDTNEQDLIAEILGIKEYNQDKAKGSNRKYKNLEDYGKQKAESIIKKNPDKKEEYDIFLEMLGVN